MSLKKLISDVKYNCEITNARFFVGEKGDKEASWERLYRIEKKIKPYNLVDDEELKNFKRRKMGMWKNMLKRTYRDVGRAREISYGNEKFFLDVWEVKEKNYTKFLLAKIRRKKELEMRWRTPVYFLGEELAADATSLSRGLTRFENQSPRIVINRVAFESDIWEMLMNYKIALHNPGFFRKTPKEIMCLDFLFSDFSDALFLGIEESIVEKRKYKDILNRWEELTEHHEIGHLLTRERYGYFPKGVESEVLADVVPGKYLSTLRYIAEEDETDNPVLFNLYMYFKYSAGDTYGKKKIIDSFMPELKDVYISFPDRISLKNLEKAIEKVFQRAERMVKRRD